MKDEETAPVTEEPPPRWATEEDYRAEIQRERKKRCFCNFFAAVVIGTAIGSLFANQGLPYTKSLENATSSPTTSAPSMSAFPSSTPTTAAPSSTPTTAAPTATASPTFAPLPAIIRGGDVVVTDGSDIDAGIDIAEYRVSFDNETFFFRASLYRPSAKWDATLFMIDDAGIDACNLNQNGFSVRRVDNRRNLQETGTLVFNGTYIESNGLSLTFAAPRDVFGNLPVARMFMDTPGDRIPDSGFATFILQQEFPTRNPTMRPTRAPVGTGTTNPPTDSPSVSPSTTGAPVVPGAPTIAPVVPSEPTTSPAPVVPGTPTITTATPTVTPGAPTVTPGTPITPAPTLPGPANTAPPTPRFETSEPVPVITLAPGTPTINPGVPTITLTGAPVPTITLTGAPVPIITLAPGTPTVNPQVPTITLTGAPVPVLTLAPGTPTINPEVPTIAITALPLPTLAPTRPPTPFPTERPTSLPSISPTPQPTPFPTTRPPTRPPTLRPTRPPTPAPTPPPTPMPTFSPTFYPTAFLQTSRTCIRATDACGDATSNGVDLKELKCAISEGSLICTLTACDRIFANNQAVAEVYFNNGKNVVTINTSFVLWNEVRNGSTFFVRNGQFNLSMDGKEFRFIFPLANIELFEYEQVFAISRRFDGASLYDRFPNVGSPSLSFSPDQC